MFLLLLGRVIVVQPVFAAMYDSIGSAGPRGWQALPDAGQAADAVPSSGPPPTPDYVWCGRSRIRMPDLAPGQHAEVHMQVSTACRWPVRALAVPTIAYQNLYQDLC